MLHVIVLVSLLFSTAVFAVGPTITNLPGATALSEDTTLEVQLLKLTITDPDSAATDIFCSLGTGSNPLTGNNKFRVRPLGDGSTDWYVYTTAGADYSFNLIPTYILDVECQDETGTIDDGTYTISLTANTPPVIQNIPSGTTQTLSTSEAIGFTVFTASSTDAEGDQIYYSITSCSPTGCPFDIYDSGAIQLNADISETTISAYDVTISVSDDTNTGSPATLTVSITGINNAPTMSNIADFNVAENVGFSVPQVTTTCTDPDGDTLSYFMACSPSTGLTYFTIVTSTGAISTSSTSNINYEQLVAAGSTSFSCTVTCSDGKKSDSDSFTINVYNVNEAPAFEQNAYSVSVNEGAGGTAIQSSGYSVIDPDSGDTKTFTMNCGAYDTYFTVDSTTGIASFAGPYDVDDGSRPTTVPCTVTVTDNGGLSETVNLEINIRNINDNTPIFAESSYFWFVSYGASISTSLGTVTATDGDTGTFGVITYSLDQSSLSPAGTYFSISDTGKVYVSSSLTPLTEGATVVIKAIATDSGSLSGTADISIVLVGTTTTTTTTTTDRYGTFFEDSRNVTWFSFCMAVVLAILCVGGVFLTKYLYDTLQLSNCCRYKRRKWRKWAENHQLEEDPLEPEPEPSPSPEPIELPPTPKAKPPADGFKFWSAYS